MNRKIFFPTTKDNSLFKKELTFISIFYLMALLYLIFCPTLTFNTHGPSGSPAFSLYSVFLFAILYLLQVLRCVDVNKKIRYSLAGTGLSVCLLLFVWQISPFSGEDLFGYYVSSYPSLIVFLFIYLFEIFRIKIVQPHLVLDIFFFIALLPLEISIIGYISKIPALSLSTSSSLVGLSIPTMTLFSLYFIYIVFSCKNLVTHRLVETDIWSRKVILIMWTFWILLIGQYSFYLQMLKSRAYGLEVKNIVFVLAFMLFIQRLLYFILLKSILKKRFSLITLCAVSKKVETPDGNWIEIEKYLKEEHFISTSHSLCPEEVEKIKAWTKD